MKLTLIRLNRYARLVLRILVVGFAVIILGIHPTIDALQSAGRAAVQSKAAGDDSHAAVAFHTLMEFEPWAVRHRVDAIEAEMRAGQHDQAERDLQTLAAVRPLNAQEVAWLGTIYAGRNQPDQAAQTWEQARALGTVDVQALTDLADLYAQRGQWQQAVSVLSTLSQINPQDAGLLAHLGMIQALDAPDAAATTLAQASALDASLAITLSPLRASLDQRASQTPDYAYATLGGIYLRLGEIQLADTAFARAIAYNPAYPDALAYYAYVQARLGRPALGAAEQAAALAPDSPSVHYFVGLTWKQMDRPADARVEFERAYALDPNNPAICVEIASTHRAEGGLDWAEIWMQEAVRLAPGDPRFRLLLVQFYGEDNYKVNEVGLSLAKQFVQEFPDSAEAHDALAWAYFQLDALDTAQDELDRAMTLDPKLARAYVHMGTLIEKRGDLSQALWYYLQAVQLDPDGPFGAIARRAVKRLGGG